MSTKIVKIVLEANGENSGTYSPLCFLENFDGNIDAKVNRFVSWDCDIYISVDQYRIVDLELPMWMEESYYLQNFINLSYANTVVKAINDDLNINEFSKTQLTRFLSLSNKYQFFYAWLHKKINNAKKENSFLVSILNQFNVWLINEEQNKYATPLTPKQFNAASQYCPLYNVEKITSTKYSKSVIY